MGIRFRKYLTLGKILRLNISKSGVSATIGIKGASVNIGKNGAYLNTGIPGTGINSREKISDNKKKISHSDEVIERARKVLDEYDKEQERIEIENRKSDIAPQINKIDLDELFLDVAYYVISENMVSPYRIKSKFGIDYVRTEEIIQQLEENGIISSSSPTQGRKILISMVAFNELKNKLNNSWQI